MIICTAFRQGKRRTLAGLFLVFRVGETPVSAVRMGDHRGSAPTKPIRKGRLKKDEPLRRQTEGLGCAKAVIDSRRAARDRRRFARSIPTGEYRQTDFSPDRESLREDLVRS